MKKLVPVISICAVLFAAVFAAPKFSARAAENESDEIIYAQIKSPAVLYEKNGETYSPAVTLPATYFAALLDETYESEYLHVSYLDITGYMKKADLEITDFEPVTKYASPVFTASNEGLSAIMRSAPNHEGDNVLALIPDGTKLLYYGETEGSSRYDGASKTWYYVKYETNGSVLHGYVYSYHGLAEPIADNVVEKVEKPAAVPDPPPEPTTPLPPRLNNVGNAVFIICLCIPAVLIMILLFRAPPKKKREPRNFRE